MLYGEQTRLAVKNFGEGRCNPKIVRSYAEVKKAAILALQRTEGYYSPEVYEGLVEAVNEIIAGKWDNEFVVPLAQGGAGTSLHMNVNEVVAKRAMEIVKEKYGNDVVIHPLDDVNRYQSTNDTFPTAITIAVLRDLFEVERQTIALQAALVEKEKIYSTQLIMGRTELQDALPMMLGQVFGAWAGMFERDRWRLHKIKERLRLISLGGTALGTGFPAPQGYVFAVEQALREVTALPLSRSQNLCDAVAHHDDWSEVASGYVLLAKNLEKLAGDFLLYTSSLCKEMAHPELQYGSTIMAQKVNPVLLEWVKGMVLRVTHLGRLVEDYHAEGNLQLNAFVPFMADALLEMADLLGRSLNGMLRFLEEVKINTEVISEHLDHSRAVLNLLLPVLGYSKTKELVQRIPSLQNLAELREWLRQEGVPQEVVENLTPDGLTRFIKRVDRRML